MRRVYLDGSLATDGDRPGEVVLGPEGTRPLDVMRPLWPPVSDNRGAASRIFGLGLFSSWPHPGL